LLLPAPAGVPIIADSKFMAAYSMIEPNAVYPQEDGKNELDIMFNVARMTPEEMWRTRLGEQGAHVLRQQTGLEGWGH
jgi:hypothetical protein